MSVNVAINKNNFEDPTAGPHLARCLGIVDIGTQEGEYEGKKTSVRKVVLIWELLDDTKSSGEPFTISAFYPAHLGSKKRPSKLREDLEAWRGKEFTPDELEKFNLDNILNAPCQLNLQPNAKKKLNIVGIMPLPKKMAAPELAGDAFSYSLEPAEFNMLAHGSLPEWLRNFIEKSPEYADRYAETQSQINGVVASQMTELEEFAAANDLPF